ncbi:Uncharacterised protein [Streptococcus gordonii]|nr:Uncharacterised protein [Streptococcus gordonii]
MFDEHKEIYLFSQTSVRIQLYKQLGYNTYLKLLRLPLSTINLVDLLSHLSVIIEPIYKQQIVATPLILHN